MARPMKTQPYVNFGAGRARLPCYSGKATPQRVRAKHSRNHRTVTRATFRQPEEIIVSKSRFAVHVTAAIAVLLMCASTGAAQSPTWSTQDIGAVGATGSAT